MPRIEEARALLSSCSVCPRGCGVDRRSSMGAETGICQTGALARVSSASPHFGEEDPLVGTGGSGTIFLTHCSLMCLFCQNYDISHMGHGQTVDSAVLSGLMVRLAGQGCHNINFVSPTHVVPQILEALPAAIEAGLDIPLVYNSGGYDMVETLRLLDGVFDIYMPDFKFWNDEYGRKYCQVDDYRAQATAALLEMHRQVGPLQIDDRGIATRGLLVRHLVMPGGLGDTAEICKFIAQKISPQTYVNIMGQYRPCGRAHELPEIACAPSNDELRRAREIAVEVGLERLDKRRRGALRIFPRE